MQENRDELFAKIEEIKQEVIGSDDDWHGVIEVPYEF